MNQNLDSETPTPQTNESNEETGCPQCGGNPPAYVHAEYNPHSPVFSPVRGTEWKRQHKKCFACRKKIGEAAMVVYLTPWNPRTGIRASTTYHATCFAPSLQCTPNNSHVGKDYPPNP